ncbi:hypothetical protein FDP41_011426 [Naegleria fowleri]|uniref:Cilia- and flagella-associated protein 52 n=1 Tax=Naegleria fowleri TaxID=5763 RepID=A0A6A5C421_NAEFO|nr:uncharacterized protein FDP41_011426 [Naegleria fowleri]KAF0982496.1 hypothetical protein FDP41_011426 [Naegleria fowleri]CAG4709116.1 unnamed protein product [Naegleria fowleri]
MSSSQASQLYLDTVIGFNGLVPDGLQLHPNQKHIIYPLGSTVVIKEYANLGVDEFLAGHSGPISCIAVSKSGQYIATGQSTHMGFKADIIVWDFEERKLMHRLNLHHAKVECLAFSDDEELLVSVGGKDDNCITVWNVQSGKPICGTNTTALGTCVQFFHNDRSTFMMAGKQMCRVYTIDFVNKRLDFVDCNLGQIKRIFTSLLIDLDDSYAYVGTTSGDILCIQLKGPKNYKFLGPKDKIMQGVLSLCFSPSGKSIFVGGGDGSVTVVNKDNLLKVTSTLLMGGVTSICCKESDNSFICGTNQSVIYSMKGSGKLEASLIATCHNHRINDVCYPREASEIIATCSINDIRVWNIQKSKELLRIQVPNLECNCITFSPTGNAIISGWSDGKIRAFGPQSGKLLYVINDAHKILGQKKVSGRLVGVTAIAMSHDSQRIVSGGSDGQVRVWQITKTSQILVASMNEHKATVNAIQIKKDDSECISASDDGTCIVWNLDKFVRANIIYAQTYFRQICYLNDESQMLTCGSDKQVTYWDAYDCTAIRELREAEEDEINTLDIDPDGQYFVSAGKHKSVNVWHYDHGEIIQQGFGHADNVTKVKFSPCGRFICSVGEEGGIFIWRPFYHP